MTAAELRQVSKLQFAEAALIRKENEIHRTYKSESELEKKSSLRLDEEELKPWDESNAIQKMTCKAHGDK